MRVSDQMVKRFDQKRVFRTSTRECLEAALADVPGPEEIEHYKARIELQRTAIHELRKQLLRAHELAQFCHCDVRAVLLRETAGDEDPPR